MWECNFAKEPMDYKLFWLRFVKKIWMIIVATVLGAVVIGVPYYLINVTFGEGPSYKVVSEYYLDYAEDGSGATYEYFNYYTWSEIVDTDEFIAILSECVPEEMFADVTTLRNYTDATVESDTRYLTTTVQTEHPDKSVAIARAMEEAILKFAEGQKEFRSVKVVTQPLQADKTYPDVRTTRAFVLGAVLGLFVGLLSVCIYLISDSSVYLPNTLERRYQIKALGCQSIGETTNNVCYSMKNMKKIALLWVGKQKTAASDSAVEFLKNTLQDTCQVCTVTEEVTAEAFDFEMLREMDAAVLMIEAGAKNGKKIERVIEQLVRQDIVLAGALLYNEDEKLIKHYYR